MKTLIATDGSQHATTAVASASRLLKRTDLTIDILCVAPELILEPAGGGRVTRNQIGERYARRIKQGSQDILARAERLLEEGGLRGKKLLEVGSPADEIIKLASDYDLVVVGAHGKFERKQPGLGPVSSRIVQNARTTVLVGRELFSDMSYRVLVALDSSDTSFEALRALKTYFDVSLLDVTLMYVLELPWARLDLEPWMDSDADASAERSGYQRELEGELRDDARRVIDRATRQLDEWGVSATTILTEGDPALEITSYVEAGNYDLVVAGATGTSDMKHALLGSVSLKLAWNCPCSVMVVRP
jgi:nucleotide-binding universal stress UspA family protein